MRGGGGADGAGGGTKAPRCAATPGRFPVPPSASPGADHRGDPGYPGTPPSPHCAWLSFGVCYCARWQSGPVPPARVPPSPQRHKIWHLGRGKAGRAAPPSPPAAGVPSAPPPRAPTPAPLLSAALRGRDGGRGSLCSTAGSFVGRSERRGQGGCRVRAAVGSPAEQPRRRDALPAGLRAGDTRALRARQGGLLEHLPLPRGSNLTRGRWCACVLVRHLEISFVRIVASLCWHRCLFLLQRSSFPTLVQNSESISLFRGTMFKLV